MRKRHVKILAGVLLAGAATYALGGFLLAPRIVTHWIEHSIATQPGKRLGVESVTVNPFTLFISLINVTLIDEKNKPVISIDRIDTRFPVLEKLRMAQAGYDVEVRDLRVTDPSSGDTIWTIPNLSVTDLVIDAAVGNVMLGTARLDKPEFHIVRDSSGTRYLPDWLRIPQDGAPPVGLLFDKLELIDGSLRFTDRALSPAIKLDADGVAGTVTRRRSAGAESMTVKLEGRFGESGAGEIVAEWGRPQRRIATTFNLALQRIELATLSPYFAQIAGRAIPAGSGDMTLNYERGEASTRIDGRIQVDRLQLGNEVATETDRRLPLQLAVALLNDNEDHIDISIQASKRSVDADPAGIVSDSLTDYVRDLAAAPFDVLADVVGRGDEELGELTFGPGSAEITSSTAEKISLLARALSQRPLLTLRAKPSYDETVDRDAIAAQQVRLHVQLATSQLTTSGGSFGRSTPTSVDFDDPKVRAILDEFSGERLPESRRSAIAARFDSKDAAYYQALYEALIANEVVSQTALRRLARFRARSIVDTLAENGVNEERLLLADAIETTAAGADAIVVRLEALHGQ